MKQGYQMAFKIRFEYLNGKIEEISASDLDEFLFKTGYDYEFIGTLENFMDKVEDGTADKEEIARLDFFINEYEYLDDHRLLGGNNVIVLNKRDNDSFFATHINEIGSGSSESQLELINEICVHMMETDENIIDFKVEKK